MTQRLLCRSCGHGKAHSRAPLSVVRGAWWGQSVWLTVKFKNKKASQGAELVNLTLRERSAEVDPPEGVWQP